MNDATSLPTIKVHVSPARKKSVKRETSAEGASKGCKVGSNGDEENATRAAKEGRSPPHRTSDAKAERLKRSPEKPLPSSPRRTEISRTSGATVVPDLKKKRGRKYTLSDDSEDAPDELEEYIPDAPNATVPCPDFKYVPSRKSALENMRLTSNEYTPTLFNADGGRRDVADAASYVPNPIEKLETTYETYEPCATTTIPESVLEEYVPNSKSIKPSVEEYVPNSKGIKPSVEEYEPDFRSPSKLMKFDDSYVPSSVRLGAMSDTKRTPDKSDRLRNVQRLEARRKGTPTKKKINDLFS